MRRTLLQWIAGISVVQTDAAPVANRRAGFHPAPLLCALALLNVASAARQPSYGGELRIETRAVINVLDPSASPEDPVALGALRQLAPLVFETYVRLDERGQPQPWLATSWTHDPAHKLWVFQLRKGLKFHDGSAYSPAGNTFSVGDEYPIEWILADLANPRNAVSLKTQDGALVGTGPFRIARRANFGRSSQACRSNRRVTATAREATGTVQWTADRNSAEAFLALPLMRAGHLSGVLFAGTSLRE